MTLTDGVAVPVKASVEVVKSIREGRVRCGGRRLDGFVFCDEMDVLPNAMPVRVVEVIVNLAVALSFSIPDGSPEVGPGCAVFLCIL